MIKTKIIRVLFVSHERKMGGANVSLYELIKELRKMGIEASVVVLYRGCPIDKEFRKIGIKTIPCLFGWWVQPSAWNLLMKVCFRLLYFVQSFGVWKLCRYVKKNKIDIIHSNSGVIDVGAIVARKTGCRHVWHFREYAEKHYNFEYIKGKNNSIDFINSYSDANIFISEALATEYNMINNKHVIYDGISDSYFAKNAYDEHKNIVTRFLVCGCLTPGKNQLDILKAVKILNSEFKLEDKIELFVAGSSTDLFESKEYEKELLKFVKNNNLHNVHFLGYVKDMTELRRKVDVEIIASKYEAYGRVTVEAMAAKHVVIVSDCGANCELVSEGETGYIYRSGNIDELVSKMIKCIDDAKLNVQIGQNAYEYAYINHRISENAKHVYILYRKLLSLII